MPFFSKKRWNTVLFVQEPPIHASSFQRDNGQIVDILAASTPLSCKKIGNIFEPGSRFLSSHIMIDSK